MVFAVQSDALTETPLATKNNYDLYPATPSLVRKYLKPERYKEWLESRNVVADVEINNSLRDYQKEGIRKILCHSSFGIFDQQRLGKTPMILSAISFFNEIQRTIIIAPKSTLEHWAEECKKWYNPDVKVINGTAKQRQNIYKNPPKVMVLTYKTIMLDYNFLNTIHFDCMIIDEAHRLRNFKGQVSKYSPKSVKAIMNLSYKIHYKYALTGTPAPNKPENIFPILHFLYPNLFTSYYKFLNYYFEQEEIYIAKDTTTLVPCGFKEGKQLQLQELLDYISLQRKRKDYMQWLPATDKNKIYLNLPKKIKMWYNELVKTFECEELGINCSNLLSLMIALRQLTTKAKVDYILDYINDYPDEQIIIASEFTSFLKDLHIKIPQAYMLIGETSTKNRYKIQEDFNKKKINIILANIEVIKEGMKLESCNTIIIADPSLTYTDNEQLEDRLLPTTKEIALEKDKQQIVYLVVKDSIDDYIDKQLENKATKVDIINNFKAYL